MNPRPVTSQETLIIAEIAQAHEGSLGMARAYIDAIATAGAQAVMKMTSNVALTLPSGRRKRSW